MTLSYESKTRKKLDKRINESNSNNRPRIMTSAAITSQRQRPAIGSAATATVNAATAQQTQAQVSFSTRQLIDLKFDQLANKVFKELTNAHNSLQLFQAIDDILMERQQQPGLVSSVTSNKSFTHNQQQLHGQYHHSARLGGSSSPQHQQQQHHSRSLNDTSFGGSSGNLQSYSSLTSSGVGTANTNTNTNTGAGSRSLVAPLRHSSFKNASDATNDADADDDEDCFSAEELNTSAESDSLHQTTPLKAQQIQSVQRHHGLNHSASVDSASTTSTASTATAGPLFKRHKNFSPGAAVSGIHDNDAASSIAAYSPYELAKSKTTVSNDIYKSASYQHQHHRHQQQKQQLQHPSQQEQRHFNRRLNPIVRSSTIGSSTTFDNGRLKQIQPLHYKQRSHQHQNSIFNKEDIGSLYKPHMNYSTSVLGNHRLSDDDEIIIVPTNQSLTSPSLTSLSPEMADSANDEELHERFSISRTKSFWERLSNTRSNQNKPVLSSY